LREERKANYYAVLELLPTATDADIKKAWHEQLQVWHPDRFNHSPTLHRKAEARTQLINQAYQTLSDPVARTRYDTATQASPSPRPPPHSSPPSPATRPQATPRSRQDLRGPQALLTLSRDGQPKITVPAIEVLVDAKEQQPYDFHGLVRIAGTIRHTLPAGDYAIAEAPNLWCAERKRVEELYTTVSNPSDRLRFLRELEGLLAFPHRCLVVEGTIQQSIAGGRLGQYHKNGLIDFLDAMKVRYGMQIIQADTREEAEERVANLAALHYAYFFAEQQGLGRYLNENDL
jgi:DnaJ-domain-containing protein 1